MKNIYLYLSFIISLTSFAQDTLTTYQRQIEQYALSSKPGLSKFMLRGYYHSGFESVSSDGTTNSNFTSGSIAPILMYRQSSKLFFEAEFEGEYVQGKFDWGMEYADVNFVLNKYMTIRAGKFLLPFGSFMEKLHPAWVNRLATKPLGIGHDGIVPGSDVGVEIRGAFYAGNTKFNYQTYIVNGPQLKFGIDEPSEAGMILFTPANDNNNNKALGGRIGVFPFSNSMLEIGLSGLEGKVGASNSIYQNVKANLYAIDFSLVKNLDFLSSILDIKGQFNSSKLSNAKYIDSEDPNGGMYEFDNKSTAFYGQVSLRPYQLSNEFLRKMEIVWRYSNLHTPEGSNWEQNATQYAYGLNYWYDWRTVIKLGFQTTKGLGGHESASTGPQNLFYVHCAIGF
jgi:hypothetical protein